MMQCIQLDHIYDCVFKLVPIFSKFIPLILDKITLHMYIYNHTWGFSWTQEQVHDSNGDLNNWPMHTTKKIMTQTAIGRFFPSSCACQSMHGHRESTYDCTVHWQKQWCSQDFSTGGPQHRREGGGGLQGDLFLIHVHQNGTFCTIVG